MEKPRATLDRGTLVHRTRHTEHHLRDLSAPRVQRQVTRRASIPQHRQPRVRLGKPTGHDTYIHWQEYLDIADLHRMPKTPVKAERNVEVHHHESVSEMFDRYRHVAETVNEKINNVFSDIRPRVAEVVPMSDGESLEEI